MRRPIRMSSALLVLCLAPHPAWSQTSSPAGQLAMAQALYYTPTSSGLRSFSCHVSVDWKGLLSRVTGDPVTDDNQFLKYLNSVKMTVNDDLRNDGKLEWTNTAEPPANLADSVAKMQQGVAQMTEGFFQSWNAYLNGSMVPAPDKSTTVTRTDSGIHLHATTDNTTVDEDYDKNMLLTKAHVLMGGLDVIASPIFSDTPDGRVISEIRNEVRQPVTAPPMYVNMSVTYQNVSNRRIPAVIHYDVKNVVQLDLNLTECTVSSDPGSHPAPKP